jgi:general secretion pathway protein G
MLPGNRRRPGGAPGFTLLELVVVITIIGILGTLVVVKVSTLPPIARAEKVKQDLQQIWNAATMIETLTGEWPAAIEDLVDPRGKDGQRLPGIDGDLKDPWGREYLYEVGEDGPIVRCLGRDGREGGEGEDADAVHPRAAAS